MHQIIIANTTVELSDKRLTITEENSWFSDSFFTKYTYPFEMIITDEINSQLGDIISTDSITGIYKIDAKYVFYDKIENSTLYVENINKRTASVSLQYGMDEFPNFDKQLKELGLFKTTVPNIYTHANQVIEMGYPQTNYNFPMIHTDKYDATDPLYYGFEQIINKRTGNMFVQNIVQNDEMLNKNIIQPMPYVMYVLKRGFELSGRVVEGDIVNDPLLNSMLIFAEKDYFSRIESSAIDLIIDESSVDQSSEFIEGFGWLVSKTFTVTQPGYYNIIGDVNIGSLAIPLFTQRVANIQIFVNNVLLTSLIDVRVGANTHFIDTFFDLQPGQTAVIEIRVESAFYVNIPVSDLQCLPVYYYDSNGNKMTNLFNSNVIDLNRSVPDITFGTFFNTLMNWFNYDVDEITENKIVINKINNSYKNNEIIDLSAVENIDVQRKKEHDNNFHIKYAEDGDVYLGGVYMDANGMEKTTKEFNKQPKNVIDINAYVLQNETISGIRTAKSNKSSEDKLCVVLYDGLIFNQNTAAEPNALEISNVVNKYHFDWLMNRIFCQSFIINFTTNIENIIYLNTKKRIYAHNNLHVIKNIQKTEIAPDIFDVEIETENILLK